MSARETIIQQDNQHMTDLLAEFDAAQQALGVAGDDWEAANNAPSDVDSHRTLEAAAALDNAVDRYRRAAAAVAHALASAWRAGYRLHPLQ